MVSGGPFTITPHTPLPQITNPVTLEGAGITIDDASVPIAPGSALTDALVLAAGSDGSTVSGLTIVGATGGAGIAIVSSDDTITGNKLGSAAAPNKFGITVFSSNNTIGGTAASAGNVISGNTRDGIFVIGPIEPPNPPGPPVTGNVIEGNTIGSTTGAGNGNAGVEIGFGATDNTVGGTAAGAGNVISGNGATGNGTPGDVGPGVLVQGAGTSANVIEGDFIGTGPAGPVGTPNPNTRAGVTFTDSASGNSVIDGTVVAGSGTPAIDAGGLANQVSMVSLAGGPMPLISGGQGGTVTAGAASASGSSVSIPVTVTGAQPNVSVEVDLLDGACTGSTASLPYLTGATTNVTTDASGNGTGTITASGDPPLPVFEASDADGPLSLNDPCPQPTATMPTSPSTAAPSSTASTSGGSSASSHTTSTTTTTTSTTSAAPSGPPPVPQFGPPSVNGDAAILSIGCLGSPGGELGVQIELCELLVLLTGEEGANAQQSNLAGAAKSHRTKPRIKTVVLGSEKVTIQAGKSENVRVTLNPAGRRLLARKHRLTVKLTITDNGRTVHSQTIVFKTNAKVKHKRRA